IRSPVAKDRRIRIGKTELAIAEVPKGSAAIFEQRDGAWAASSDLGSEGKRPGLQGPIDDAFASPFLCVRGTGKPWNEGVQKWADAGLQRFADEWRFWFRGELPVKDDTQVTADDLKTRHIVLFGDPGSNRWIAEALPKLPLSWTREDVRLPGRSHPAADQAPRPTCPRPF